MTSKLLEQRGFTLIELVVTLSIVALVLTIGIPGFQQLIRDNRLTTQYNDFVSALNITRSEAIKRGVDVTICKRDAAGSNCNDAGNWEDGWIIFTDLDSDGTVDANEILRVREALAGNNTLRRNTNQDRITYTGQGFAAAASTFQLCDIRGVKQAKGLVISANGRARRAIDSNRDGIVESGTGNITCP